MNPFLYFIPGRPNADQVKQIIPHLPPHSRAENTQGIEGCGPGYLYCDQRSGSPQLHPQQQHWQQSGCGKYYLGWNLDAKPTPADLEKPSLIDGVEIKGWIIPKVRQWVLEDQQQRYFDRLPRKPKWDGVKFVAGDISDRYRPISDLAEQAFQMIAEMYTNSEGDQLTMPEDAPLVACQIMGVNYFIGPDEFAALPAFDYSFTDLVGILRIFTGFDDLMELQDAEKKTDLISA